MTVRVEFFGIPRQLTGVAEIQLQADTLADVLESLDRCFPAFGSTCLHQNSLKPGFIANVNGLAFTKAGQRKLNDGDAVLILSADAGG